MLDFLRCFQWYRAWRGGTWYYVRDIYSFGQIVLYEWTRTPEKHQYTVKSETY